MSPFPSGEGGLNKRGFAPLKLPLYSIRGDIFSHLVYGSLLGAHGPCGETAFTPFWGVQRGETPSGTGVQGGVPLEFSPLSGLAHALC